MKFTFYNDFISDWRAYLLEFLGTFFSVFFTASFFVNNFVYKKLDTLGLALGVGLLYSALVFVTVGKSGGYLNPAITLSLWLGQRLSAFKTIVLIAAQLLGAILGYVLISFFYGKITGQFGIGGPILGLDVSFEAAIVAEFLGTALLIFAVFATAVDRSGPASFGPLVLGLILFAVSLFAIPISGAGINPARAIGAAVVSNNYNQLIIWVLGPIAASSVGLLYDLLFLKRTKKK